MLLLLHHVTVEGWTTENHRIHPGRLNTLHTPRHCPVLETPTLCRRFLSSDDSSSETTEPEDVVERTSFDQAGQSLTEQEDQKRLDMMGDFDSQGVRVSKLECAKMKPNFVFTSCQRWFTG